MGNLFSSQKCEKCPACPACPGCPVREPCLPCPQNNPAPKPYEGVGPAPDSGSEDKCKGFDSVESFGICKTMRKMRYSALKDFSNNNKTTSDATLAICDFFNFYAGFIVAEGNNFIANTFLGDKSKLPCALGSCGATNENSITYKTFMDNMYGKNVAERTDTCSSGFYPDSNENCTVRCPSCAPLNLNAINPEPDNREGFQNFSNTYNSGQSYSWAYLLLLFTVIWQSIFIFSQKSYIKKIGGPMIISVLVIFVGLYQFIDRR